MDPIAKRYISCINLILTDYTEANHLWAETQADFWPQHWLKDLTVPADYCIDRA